MNAHLRRLFVFGRRRGEKAAGEEADLGGFCFRPARVERAAGDGSRFCAAVFVFGRRRGREKAAGEEGFKAAFVFGQRGGLREGCRGWKQVSRRFLFSAGWARR